MKKLSAALILAVFTVSMLLVPAFADEEVSLISLDPDPFQISPAPDLTPLPETTPQPTIPPQNLLGDGTIQITITAGGDMTIGGDVRKRGDSLFDKELKKQGGDLNFLTRNVREILEGDDMTIVNFEGTLTTAPVYKTKNDFVFSAPPEYVSILREGSIEAVALQNNHVMDHGETGLNETKAVLNEAGIVWSDAKNMGIYEVHGVSIAMLSYQQYREMVEELLVRVPNDVAKAKAEHDIVIVSFHWGEELDYKPNANQVRLGRLTVDAGADLVLGHHSHRINPIEEYKGKYIVYSLGNFSFSGNNKPSDMSTFLFQIRFNVTESGTQTDSFRIIPSRISSKTDYNDFAPTPFTDQRLIDNVINMLKNNGKNLEYAVREYPVDWE